MLAGHIVVNILYWTCTFNFRPKFERRSSLPFRPVFFGHTIALGIFGFFAENQSQNFLGFFDINRSYLVWIIPSLSCRPIRTPAPRQNEQTVGLGKPYFSKLLTSLCRQIRRWEHTILLSTYYTGCVHSILGQNLNGARRRRFGQFFRPYYSLRNYWIFR